MATAVLLPATIRSMSRTSVPFSRTRSCIPFGLSSASSLPLLRMTRPASLFALLSRPARTIRVLVSLLCIPLKIFLPTACF
nr:MAG TPA: hypothetical protein [Caudoviricetes sp.]